MEINPTNNPDVPDVDETDIEDTPDDSDELDEAVIDADDTGMLATERAIVDPIHNPKNTP
jgi:hypothetical protein